MSESLLLLFWSLYSRCPPIFDVLLRYLAAYMAAASAFLQEQVRVQNCTAMARLYTPSGSNQVTVQEREELRVALNAIQESAMIQLLLEVCLPTEQDKEVRVGKNLVIHCGV